MNFGRLVEADEQDLTGNKHGHANNIQYQQRKIRRGRTDPRNSVRPFHPISKATVMPGVLRILDMDLRCVEL